MIIKPKEPKNNIANIRAEIDRVTQEMGAGDLKNVMIKIAGAESSWAGKATNTNSSAFGLFQFTKPTRAGLARNYQELKGIEDDSYFTLEKQNRAMVYLTREHRQSLKNEADKEKFGKNFEITDDVIYGAHFAGPNYAKEIYSDLTGNKMMSEIFPRKEMDANKNVHLTFPHDKKIYLADFDTNKFKQWTKQKMKQSNDYDDMTPIEQATYRSNLPEGTPTADGNFLMIIFENIGKILSAALAAVGDGVNGIANLFTSDSPSAGNATLPMKIASGTPTPHSHS